ncbi:hypothetical protein MHI32_01480 [Paenibacillus sp. FSL H7-0690]|uniref:hypothetical protein n=1 Tax=Paenibacillus sp. FSL H7-0690 TaxID=2921437 RepID=UPI0030ED2E82
MVKVKGANEYYGLIKMARERRLGDLEKTRLGYVLHGGDGECYRNGNVLYVTASHARGKTFFIYLIDENSNLFKVYGVTGGNPGWTETYGWLHKGTWVKPILQYFRNLEGEIVEHDEKIEQKKREKEREQNKGIGEQINKFNAMFR